ncbi:hypothetical protein SCE1572_34540 [Sorangium cellulosum So0157-2]|uniref:Uncharacterized protein n=1 Tax=Sorangium cellulosum So0157-2 TaxID=1254432 RepID=S4Y2X7_SORCE|nr:hypothetical protein SCE1572_34540 [Sorangium cellulosum So0157-2]
MPDRAAASGSIAIATMRAPASASARHVAPRTVRALLHPSRESSMCSSKPLPAGAIAPTARSAPLEAGLWSPRSRVISASTAAPSGQPAGAVHRKAKGRSSARAALEARGATHGATIANSSARALPRDVRMRAASYHGGEGGPTASNRAARRRARAGRAARGLRPARLGVARAGLHG